MPVATAVTIGNFDGVHAGHAALVRRARELAREGGRVVVLSFDPHPVGVLRPGNRPTRLTTFAARVRLLEELGADEVVRLEPTGELLGRSPESFVEWVVGEFAPDAIVEGRDFRFGNARAGDMQTLQRLGGSHGFVVDVVGAVQVGMTDQSVVVASSSIARWLLSHGRVRDLASVLGRPYTLAGRVVRGDRVGRTIGYPTANMDCESEPPADGVYAAAATLPDGRRVGAALSVGTRETFDGADRRVEAYLMGVDATGSGSIEGLDEYGWRLELELVGWVRGQARFADVESLVGQMGRDCDRAGAMLAGSDVAIGGAV